MAAMEDGSVGTVVGGSGNRDTTSAGSSGSTTTSATHDLGGIKLLFETKMLDNPQAYEKICERLFVVLGRTPGYSEVVKTHFKKVLEHHGSSDKQLNLVLNSFKAFLSITSTLQELKQPLENLDDTVFMGFWECVISSSDENWVRFLKDSGGEVDFKEVIPKDVLSGFGFVAVANKEKGSKPSKSVASVLQSFHENLSWIEDQNLEHKKHILPFLQAVSSCFQEGESWTDSPSFEKILVKHHSVQVLKLLLEIVWKLQFAGNGSQSFTQFFQSISIEASESTKTFLARLKSSFQTSFIDSPSSLHQASSPTTSVSISKGKGHQSSGTVDQEARRLDAHPEVAERDGWKSKKDAGNLQSEEKKTSKDLKVAGIDSKGELRGREGKSSTLASTLASLESYSKPSSRNEENIEGSRASSHLSSDSRIDHESSPTSTSRATGGTGGKLVERSSKLEKAGKDGNDGRNGGHNQASRTETRDESRDVNATFETPNVTSAASPSATSTQVATQPTTHQTENAVPQTPKDSKRSREPGSSGNKRPSKKLELSLSSSAQDEEANSFVYGPSISSQGGTLTHHRQATGKGMDCEESDANSSMVDDSSLDGASILTRGHHLGSTDSTVAASSQDTATPPSYSEVLSSKAGTALNKNTPDTADVSSTVGNASSSSRPEGTRVASTSTSTSTPYASSNGNGSSTSTSRSIPHQGQQPVKGATDKASSKSTDSAKGTPFTTAQSDGDEENLPSRPATNSGIEGRSKAAEGDGNETPGLNSFSQGRALTTNQNETTGSLPTAATQPARAETDSPGLSPSNSSSRVGMTTSTSHPSFTTSGSNSRFGFGPTLESVSSFSSNDSQSSLIEGEDGKEGETKGPIVESFPTSSATDGGFQGKVGEIEASVGGTKSNSNVEDSEEVKRENVSGDPAESSNASSNLSEHAKKEISTGSASLNQGGNQIESSPTESSARITGSNSFDPSSQASFQGQGPVTSSAPPAPLAYSANDYQKNQENPALSPSPSTNSVLQATVLSQVIKAIEGLVISGLEFYRPNWRPESIGSSVGLIQAEVDQLLSDAKKDLVNILLSIPTRLDKKDFTLVASQEEEDASFYQRSELRRLDPEVRENLHDVLEEIQEKVEDMDRQEARFETMKRVKVAAVLYERTLNVLVKYISTLKGMVWRGELRYRQT